MVNKRFWLVMPVMVLVFGMMVVDSAFGQDTALNGKWRARAKVGEYENDIVGYTFLAGNYEILREWGPALHEPFEKGTYTTNDKGVIILKPTHYFDKNGEKWYSKNDFIKEMKSEGYTDAQIKKAFEDEMMFIDRSFVYSIENILGFQTLQLYQDRRKFTYYKQ